MARIKTVLTERVKVHNEAVKLVNEKQAGNSSIPSPPSHADILLSLNQQTINKRTEFSRRVRQALNYWRRRQPLFT